MNTHGTPSGGWPELRLSRGQVEAKFKHAAEFGVTAGRSRAGFDEFEQALRDFVRTPGSIRVRGTYNGQPAIITVDKESGLMVLQEPDGEFWTCWRLNPQQLMHALRDGKLGGR
jgi:hypothetical protein